MKTIQINLAVTSMILMASFSANAQTNVEKSNATIDRTEAKKEIKLLNEIPTTKKTVVTNSLTAVKPAINGNARVSDYMRMEKKIMSMTIAGDIPVNFPKHVDGQTKDEYKLIAKNWGRNNLNLIKKEFHVRILANETNPKTTLSE
jgi:hypothetical protein